MNIIEKNIILVGYGGVGKSLIKILAKDEDYLSKQYGVHFKIAAICELEGALVPPKPIEASELVRFSNIQDSENYKKGLKTNEVIKQVNSHILVECTWTNPKTGEPALSHVITALKKGMHIASSNKGPFYLQYKEIMKLAKENNAIIGIESTVGSAIPCLAAKDSLSGTHIKRIRAILNGTSNFILSRMSSENLSFDLALKEAQALGYAEADPTLDIEGYDAAGKLVILANVLLGWDKTIEDVDIKGIKHITPQAIQLAKKDNYVIKHVAVAENQQLSTGLQLVPIGSPLAVDGTLNVIELETENAGPLIYIGRGAGGPEAASGILSDMINIARRSS